MNNYLKAEDRESAKVAPALENTVGEDNDEGLAKFALEQLLSKDTSKDSDVVALDNERARLEMALNEVQHDSNN